MFTFSCYFVRCCLYTHKLTMKGCRISCRMFFSFFTCSTCFSLMTSLMARIFIAPYFLVDLSRQRHTRPKVPVPKTINTEILTYIPRRSNLVTGKGVPILNFGTICRRMLSPYSFIPEERPPPPPYPLDRRSDGLHSQPERCGETEISNPAGNRIFLIVQAII